MYILLLIIMLITSGCATNSTLPNATGTQKPYKINGKLYRPISEVGKYTEKGIASWYGQQFHGNKTSNGEIYDMHKLTAAHKTLPMNTYVKVTLERNKKSVIVRINDRGPFVSGRIIDLSFKAAKQIGIDQTGTGRVEITALGKTVNNKLVRSDYSQGNFIVQVGAFIVEKNAISLSKRLRKDFDEVYITQGRRYGKTFFRVRVGGFDHIVKAKRARRQLMEKGLKTSFIISGDN